MRISKQKIASTTNSKVKLYLLTASFTKAVLNYNFYEDS